MRDFGRLQLTQEVAEAFRSIVDERITELAAEIADGQRALVTYAASNPPIGYETEVIRIEEGDHLHAALQPLAKPAAIPAFGNSPREFNQLPFHSVTLQRAGQTAAVAFRLFTRSRALHRSKKLAVTFRTALTTC